MQKTLKGLQTTQFTFGTSKLSVSHHSYFLCECNAIITYRALLHIDCACAEETHSKFFKFYEKNLPKWQNQCLLPLQRPLYLGMHCINPYSRNLHVKIQNTGEKGTIKKRVVLFCYVCTLHIDTHISHDINELRPCVFL